MTKEKLIELLSQYPDGLEVVADDLDARLCSITDVLLGDKKIILELGDAL